MTVNDARSTLTTCIPNYNDGEHLQRTVEAVFAQSRPPDELLVVDDGSTDDSLDRIRALADRYPAMRYVALPVNGGVVAALNVGLQHSRGRFIHFGSANDVVVDGFYEAVMNLFEQHPGAGVGLAQVESIRPDGTRECVAPRRWTDNRFVGPATYMDELLVVEQATFSLSAATIYRRDELEAIGGFPSSLYGVADLFALTAIALRSGAVYVAQPGAKFVAADASFGNEMSLRKDVTERVLDDALALMKEERFAPYFGSTYPEAWRKASSRFFRHRRVLRRISTRLRALDRAASRLGLTSDVDRWIRGKLDVLYRVGR